MPLLEGLTKEDQLIRRVLWLWARHSRGGAHQSHSFGGFGTFPPGGEKAAEMGFLERQEVRLFANITQVLQLSR